MYGNDVAGAYEDDGIEGYNAERYRRARERVEQVRGFYSHAITFVLVNVLLFAINMLTSSDYLWFVWPLLGWGIGLAAHAFSTFGAAGLLGQKWEERKLRQLMGRDTIHLE